jgi:hypothetical protein
LLNEQQKAELKKVQLDWTKKRDAFVVNTPPQKKIRLAIGAGVVEEDTYIAI